MRKITLVFLGLMLSLALQPVTGSQKALANSSQFSKTVPLFGPLVDTVTGLPPLDAPDVAVPFAPAAVSPWVKYANNPVLNPGTMGSWDASSVTFPSVRYVSPIYQMWYSGGNGPGSSYRIGYATSLDGITWNKNPSNPVLSVGPSVNWDSGLVTAPNVLYDGGVYKMWYRGTATPLVLSGAIGYAVSNDGIVWTKPLLNPVLDVGAPGAWDGTAILGAWVSRINSSYQMWYSGCDATTCQIGLATSLDGTTWAKSASNPILTIGSSGSLDAKFAYYPAVIFDGTKYDMWYAAYRDTPVTFTIHHATSMDGVSWIKDQDNPMLSAGPSSWDSLVVSSMTVIAQSNTYKMWYTGGAVIGTYSLGYATAPIIDIGTLTNKVYLPTTFKP